MANITSDGTVERVFGSWRAFFADAHIVGLSIETDTAAQGRVTRLIMKIVKSRRAVTLHFDDVTDLELNELREQNVLDAVELTDAIGAGGRTRICVSLDACYGACGRFQCAGVSVAQMEALDDGPVSPSSTGI